MFALTRKNSTPWHRCALFIVGALLVSCPALAGSSDIYLANGGGDYSVKVKTFAERRFVDVVHQHYDFSCGSAAIATLLSYHYGHPIDEMEVLTAMYTQGDQEKIRKQGFSLLDMKHYLESIGYHAEGFKEPLDKLERVGIPAIVLINKHGYLHFVVVKGVTKDKVSVGDPTLGVTIYNRQEFIKMWNGILFVIVDNMNIARPSFNSEAAWRPYGVPQFRNMLETNQLGLLNTAYSPGFF